MKSFYELLPKEKKGKWFESVEESIDFLRKSIRVEDIIMIKGSKSMRLSLLLDELSSLGSH
jgi:UDP-N-acetylmuramoyl-tripeptide--D-alanyl-D-alanine ligase